MNNVKDYLKFTEALFVVLPGGGEVDPWLAVVSPVLDHLPR
jgi:hypothetical protein